MKTISFTQLSSTLISIMFAGCGAGCGDRPPTDAAAVDPPQAGKSDPVNQTRPVLAGGGGDAQPGAAPATVELRHNPNALTEADAAARATLGGAGASGGAVDDQARQLLEGITRDINRLTEQPPAADPARRPAVPGVVGPDLPPLPDDDDDDDDDGDDDDDALSAMLDASRGITVPPGYLVSAVTYVDPTTDELMSQLVIPPVEVPSTVTKTSAFTCTQPDGTTLSGRVVGAHVERVRRVRLTFDGGTQVICPGRRTGTLPPMVTDPAFFHSDWRLFYDIAADAPAVVETPPTLYAQACPRHGEVLGAWPIDGTYDPAAFDSSIHDSDCSEGAGHTAPLDGAAFVYFVASGQSDPYVSSSGQMVMPQQLPHYDTATGRLRNVPPWFGRKPLPIATTVDEGGTITTTSSTWSWAPWSCGYPATTLTPPQDMISHWLYEAAMQCTATSTDPTTCQPAYGAINFWSWWFGTIQSINAQRGAQVTTAIASIWPFGWGWMHPYCGGPYGYYGYYWFY